MPGIKLRSCTNLSGRKKVSVTNRRCTLSETDNLIEMSLRLNESSPIFQTIREILGIARRPKSRRKQRLNDGPIYCLIKRQKPQKVFVFIILYSVKLNFQILT